MVVLCNGIVLANKVKVADSFFPRLKGLLGKKSLTAGEGLLLANCYSVHSLFMRISIDAVYLSADLTVLGYETLPPWSIGKHIKGSVHILELAAGTALVSAGNVLEIYNNSAAEIKIGGKLYAGNKQ